MAETGGSSICATGNRAKEEEKEVGLWVMMSFNNYPRFRLLDKELHIPYVVTTSDCSLL